MDQQFSKFVKKSTGTLSVANSMEVENEFSFSRTNAKIQITPQNTEASFGPIPDFVPVDNMEIIEVNEGKNGGVTLLFFKFLR